MIHHNQHLLSFFFPFLDEALEYKYRGNLQVET